MDFFQRRLSRPLPPPPNVALQLSPPTIKSSSLRATPSRLIRRVSTLFSTRKRPPLPPICNIAVPCKYHSRSPSPAFSDEEDIRRPSGLGPRAGSVVSNHSLPSPFDLPNTFDIGPRSRSVSSPNLLRSNIRGLVSETWSKPLPLKPVTVDIPAEVLEVIFSFLPRVTVASLALVSRLFYRATRSVLYRTLDLRTLRPKRVEQLHALLARRQDLVLGIRTFICDDWPPSVCSLFHPSAPPFSVALNSMRNLTVLTIPSFDPTILCVRLPFRLTRLTILNTTMSLDEQVGLFAWLDGQPEITYLAFPNLIEKPQNDIRSKADVDKHDPGATPLLNTTPTPTPMSSAFPKSHPPSCTPFSSPFLLPVLMSLHAPPTLATLLAPVRALTEVTVHIQTTLYAGLRPSALMAAFQGIKCLALRFGEHIDRRSVEKVLGAAGAVLGSQEGSEPLEILEVEVQWPGDEELYRIISCVLPRFRALRILRLHRLACATNPDSKVAFPVFEPLGPDVDSLENGGVGDNRRAYAQSWAKHCPGLRVVKFPSGQEWHKDK